MKKDILRYIEESMDGFSKGQRQIAHVLLDHYDKAVFLTAGELGHEANVSESTVVRFTVELGFTGYAEFQRALREAVKTRLTSVQRMEAANKMFGDEDIPGKVLTADIEKIRTTLENLDREAFQAAVTALANARTVYVIGVRSSSIPAGHLTYNLRMISDNVRRIETDAGAELFEQVMDIGKGDVLFAISFPRYSKRVIRAVNFCAGRGADIIALTDSRESPIAADADQLLLAQSDMASFVDSLTAPLSVINAVIVALSRAKEDAVADRLTRLEHIWDEYDVYDKSSD